MKDRLRELVEWMRDINGHCADALIEILEQQAEWPSDADGDDTGLPAGMADWYNRTFMGQHVDNARLDYCEKAWRAALQSVRPPASDRDAYEGAREDLLDWKHRALSAESILRSLGYGGLTASEAPIKSDAGEVSDGGSVLVPRRILGAALGALRHRDHPATKTIENLRAYAHAPDHIDASRHARQVPDEWSTEKNGDQWTVTYTPHAPDAADSGRAGLVRYEHYTDGDESGMRECKDGSWVLFESALAAQGQGEAEVPRSMETAPRDGQMLRLLVRFEEHATEDAEEAWTIGANTRGGYADGRDNWQFAGWCWTHDHFTEGKGTPIGWLPMIDSAASPAGVPDGWVKVSEKLPASGVPVIAYLVNGCGNGRRIRAMYAASKSLEGNGESDFEEYDEEADIYWCPEGWYETNEYEETHWSVADPVTHWMTLPAAPSATPEGGEVVR